jgi:hypothetical protein
VAPRCRSILEGAALVVCVGLGMADGVDGGCFSERELLGRYVHHG